MLKLIEEKSNFVFLKKSKIIFVDLKKFEKTSKKNFFGPKNFEK